MTQKVMVDVMMDILRLQACVVIWGPKLVPRPDEVVPLDFVHDRCRLPKQQVDEEHAGDLALDLRIIG